MTGSPTWWRRAGWFLIAAAAWTAFVWVNRLVNLIGDDRSAAFVAVHAALALVSLGFAGPVAWIGWRLTRRG
ncbi:MAG: hypothetical protein RIB67_11075 [Miltoncostaeaceae bacterium]